MPRFTPASDLERSATLGWSAVAGPGWATAAECFSGFAQVDGVSWSRNVNPGNLKVWRH